MIKALPAIQDIKNNPNNNYLLVGDSDFLYLYLKKIIKESNVDLIETNYLIVQIDQHHSKRY